VCSFAGEFQRNESGGDFRRRTECARRQTKREFGAGKELSGDRKITVLFGGRAGGESRRDFELNDDVSGVDECGIFEKTVENWRGDVIGKIPVDVNAATGGESGEIGFEDVTRNDGEVRMGLGQSLQSRNQGFVEFDGDYGSAGLHEMLSHLAVTGTDFDPAEVLELGGLAGYRVR